MNKEYKPRTGDIVIYGYMAKSNGISFIRKPRYAIVTKVSPSPRRSKTKFIVQIWKPWSDSKSLSHGRNLQLHHRIEGVHTKSQRIKAAKVLLKLQ